MVKFWGGISGRLGLVEPNTFRTGNRVYSLIISRMFTLKMNFHWFWSLLVLDPGCGFPAVLTPSTRGGAQDSTGNWGPLVREPGCWYSVVRHQPNPNVLALVGTRAVPTFGLLRIPVPGQGELCSCAAYVLRFSMSVLLICLVVSLK